MLNTFASFFKILLCYIIYLMLIRVEFRREQAADPRLSSFAGRHADAAACHHGADRGARWDDLRDDDLSLHAAAADEVSGGKVISD